MEYVEFIRFELLANSPSVIPFAMQLGLTLNDRQSDDFKTHVLKAGDYSLHQLMARFDSKLKHEAPDFLEVIS